MRDEPVRTSAWEARAGEVENWFIKHVIRKICQNLHVNRDHDFSCATLYPVLTFINLTDHDRTLYLLRLDNDKTSHIIAKYAHLMFQKRKQFQKSKNPID